MQTTLLKTDLAPLLGTTDAELSTLSGFMLWMVADSGDWEIQAMTPQGECIGLGQFGLKADAENTLAALRLFYGL